MRPVVGFFCALPRGALHEVWRLVATWLTEAELYRLLLTERCHHIVDASDVAVLYKNACSENRNPAHAPAPLPHQSPFLSPAFWKRRYARLYSACSLTRSILASPAPRAALLPLELYALYKALCQVAETSVCPVCNAALGQWADLLQRRRACGTRRDWEAVRCARCSAALSARRSYTAWTCYRRIASPFLGCLSGLPPALIGAFEGFRPVYHSNEDGCCFGRMQLRIRHPFGDLRNVACSPRAFPQRGLTDRPDGRDPASGDADFPILLCLGCGHSAGPRSAVAVYLSSALLLVHPRRRRASAGSPGRGSVDDRFEVRLYSLAQKLDLHDAPNSGTGSGNAPDLENEQNPSWYWTAKVPPEDPHSYGPSDVCDWDSQRGFWFGHAEDENAALFVDASSSFAVSNPSIPFRLWTSLFPEVDRLSVETNGTENATPIRFLEVWAPYWAESPAQFHPRAVAFHQRVLDQALSSPQSHSTPSPGLAALRQQFPGSACWGLLEAARDSNGEDTATEASGEQAEGAPPLPTSRVSETPCPYAHRLGKTFPSPAFRGEAQFEPEDVSGDASSALRAIRAQNRRRDAALARELLF